MTAPVLVFDLDGTLVDTAADLVATLNTVLAREEIAPVPFATARAMVGRGARAMITSAIEQAGGVAGADRLDHLTSTFIAHYSAHIADESRPYPGVPEALQRFHDDGWRLAVCTNKIQSLARKLLMELQLLPRFAAVAGQDTFGVAKPDPRMLTSTIAAAGGTTAAAVMVGDSSIDVETARRARVPVVFATFGYGPAPAPNAPPDRSIGRFSDLYDAVAGLSRPRMDDAPQGGFP